MNVQINEDGSFTVNDCSYGPFVSAHTGQFQTPEEVRNMLDSIRDLAGVLYIETDDAF